MSLLCRRPLCTVSVLAAASAAAPAVVVGLVCSHDGVATAPLSQRSGPPSPLPAPLPPLLPQRRCSAGGEAAAAPATPAVTVQLTSCTPLLYVGGPVAVVLPSFERRLFVGGGAGGSAGGGGVAALLPRRRGDGPAVAAKRTRSTTTTAGAAAVAAATVAALV